LGIRGKKKGRKPLRLGRGEEEKQEEKKKTQNGGQLKRKGRKR